MANEFRRVKDANGVYHPVTDDNRVSWAANGVLGAQNIEINNLNTQTLDDITLTVNDDKSITFSTPETGAGATHEFLLYATLVKGKTYEISGCPAGGSWSTYNHYINGGDISATGNMVDNGDGATFIANETKNVKVRIRIVSGTILTTPITFYPMIVPAEVTDNTYTEGAMTNRALTEELNKNIIEIRENATTFNVPLKRKETGYTFGLVISGYFIAYFFINTPSASDAVTFVTVKDVSSTVITLTGSYADDVLTITGSQTINGGIMVITGNV